MPAETLNCPMCGAPAPADAVRCDHCGAPLATVTCPSCFGMIFRGAKFCPHCGAKLTAAEVTDAPTELCPRCKVDLEAVLVGKAHLRECNHCGGVWVNTDTLQKICADNEEQSAVLGMAAPVAPPESSPLEKQVRYLPCPVCKKLMNRVNFAHCSGVVVDVCKGHGTWFDKDELRRIVEFIRAGGLDKARVQELAELQQQRHELNEARTSGATLGSTGSLGGSFLADHHIGITAAASALMSFLETV